MHVPQEPHRPCVAIRLHGEGIIARRHHPRSRKSRSRAAQRAHRIPGCPRSLAMREALPVVHSRGVDMPDERHGPHGARRRRSEGIIARRHHPRIRHKSRSRAAQRAHRIPGCPRSLAMREALPVVHNRGVDMPDERHGPHGARRRRSERIRTRRHHPRSRPSSCRRSAQRARRSRGLLRSPAMHEAVLTVPSRSTDVPDDPHRPPEGTSRRELLTPSPPEQRDVGPQWERHVGRDVAGLIAAATR